MKKKPIAKTFEAAIPLADFNADCAAQHFGPWLVDANWFHQAVTAIESGTFKAASPESAGDTQYKYRITNDGIAVVPIVGQMVKGDSSFGGTSSVRVRQAIRSIAADESVRAILLHIDSPGGTVAGTAELAEDVAKANQQKPVYAHIEDLGASAAYWVASQARRITANSTALVGSIGTVAMVADSSAAAEKAGIKVHVISTGPYKGAFAPGTPVTDEHLDDMREKVEDLNSHFLAGVMRGRNITEDKLKSVADGRVFVAAKAKDHGLIDEVASLDAVMQAISQEIYKMENPVEAFKAENPDAYQAILKEGYDKAKAELAPKPALVADLKAAFSDHRDFVLDILDSNPSMEQAKAKFADHAVEQIKAKDAKIAELEAKLAKSNEGQAGVGFSTSTAPAAPDDSDPRAVAEYEWDNKPEVRQGFSSKETYTFYRINDLAGRVKILKRDPDKKQD